MRRTLPLLFAAALGLACGGEVGAGAGSKAGSRGDASGAGASGTPAAIATGDGGQTATRDASDPSRIDCRLICEYAARCAYQSESACLSHCTPVQSSDDGCAALGPLQDCIEDVTSTREPCIPGEVDVAQLCPGVVDDVLLTCPAILVGGTSMQQYP